MAFPGFAATGFTAYRRKTSAKDYLQATANRDLPCRRGLMIAGALRNPGWGTGHGRASSSKRVNYSTLLNRELT